MEACSVVHGRLQCHSKKETDNKWVFKQENANQFLFPKWLFNFEKVEFAQHLISFLHLSLWSARMRISVADWAMMLDRGSFLETNPNIKLRQTLKRNETHHSMVSIRNYCTWCICWYLRSNWKLVVFRFLSRVPILIIRSTGSWWYVMWFDRKRAEHFAERNVLEKNNVNNSCSLYSGWKRSWFCLWNQKNGFTGSVRIH